MEFTEQQIERYSRHIILPEVGGKGQKKLAAAKVLIIGAGGLGSPAALYLAAAGIGTIGLVDGDVVDLSNLQRQILHTTTNINKPKVDSGREMLTAINPDVAVKTYQVNVNADNILGILGEEVEKVFREELGETVHFPEAQHSTPPEQARGMHI